MTEVREYFNKKYDRSENNPAFLQGVLRTIDKMPVEEEEDEVEGEIVEK